MLAGVGAIALIVSLFLDWFKPGITAWDAFEVLDLELIPVETMDDVFAAALHRVILPQKVGGNFVIEVDDEEEEVEVSELPRAAKGKRES